LDLGCGVGRHTLHLTREGRWVVGGDLSVAGLQRCALSLRREGLPRRLVRHDMTRLPFADRSFDGLVAFHVIYHTTTDGLRAAVDEIRRVLRTGGEAYLTLLGRLEENVARCRADVARGICREIEPFTFVYVREAPGDKDIPHHYCDETEVRDLLTSLETLALVPVRSEYVDEDGEEHRSLHYHVQVRRI
jgi:SAM-dependent methyltransferase